MVDGRKRFECGMRGPAFFDNGEKISLLKYIRIRVEVALVISLQVPVFLGGENKAKEKKTT